MSAGALCDNKPLSCIVSRSDILTINMDLNFIQSQLAGPGLLPSKPIVYQMGINTILTMVFSKPFPESYNGEVLHRPHNIRAKTSYLTYLQE